jgi:hypothetical protein
MDKNFIPFFAGGLAASTFWLVAFPAGVIKVYNRCDQK